MPRVGRSRPPSLADAWPAHAGICVGRRSGLRARCGSPSRLGGRLHRHRIASGLDALNNKAANLPAATPFKLVTVMTRRSERRALRAGWLFVTRDPEETEFHH